MPERRRTHQNAVRTPWAFLKTALLATALLSSAGVASAATDSDVFVSAHRRIISGSAQEAGKVVRGLSDRFLRLDPKDLHTSELDTVGVVSGQPISATNLSGASGVLVSPCHVLTALHVVNGPQSAYFSVGHQEGDQGFRYLNIEAQVVAAGATFSELGLPPGQFGAIAPAQFDWAVLKLSSAIPAKLARLDMVTSASSALVLVGYPHSELTKHPKASYRFAYGKLASGEKLERYGLTLLSVPRAPGASGGAIFRMTADENGSPALALQGLYLGGVGATQSIAVDIPTVLEGVKFRAPRVFAELEGARSSSTCK